MMRVSCADMVSKRIAAYRLAAPFSMEARSTSRSSPPLLAPHRHYARGRSPVSRRCSGRSCRRRAASRATVDTTPPERGDHRRRQRLLVLRYNLYADTLRWTKPLAPPPLAWTFSLSSVSPIILHHIHLRHGQPVYHSVAPVRAAPPWKRPQRVRVPRRSLPAAPARRLQGDHAVRRGACLRARRCRVPPARRCRSQFSPTFFIFFFCSFLSLSFSHFT
ncbi:hypothetical protein B0H13DRAFT_244026 [Mycena leptocephala]|nr:hypothetical protein B0H13DRAFT_244026 [Mycena leptocephala]